MDKDLLIQNVIHFCTLKKEYPTKACEAAGVGKSFVSDVRRGQVPSVEKVQMLADYLGVTTSQLLGEETKKEPTPEGEHPKSKLRSIARLEDSKITPEQDEQIADYIDFLLSKKKDL